MSSIILDIISDKNYFEYFKNLLKNLNQMNLIMNKIDNSI